MEIKTRINKGRRQIISPIEGENWTTPEILKDQSEKLITANFNGICAMP